MPTAADIEARLNEERVGRRAQRYLRDLRRDAVIDYR
jgi:peptidyl-prolyl cis-trans isomerase SurA